MRFQKYLLEWTVKYGYAGRNTTVSSPIIWMYLTKPNIGLIWSDTNGDVYHRSKKVNKIDGYGPNMTHKNLLVAAYNKIKDLNLTGNMRNDIDTLADEYYLSNVRGRIAGQSIYVYDVSNENYKRLADKAVDEIYDYVQE
jgi:hypothetical protein